MHFSPSPPPPPPCCSCMPSLRHSNRPVLSRDVRPKQCLNQVAGRWAAITTPQKKRSNTVRQGNGATLHCHPSKYRNPTSCARTDLPPPARRRRVRDKLRSTYEVAAHSPKLPTRQHQHASVQLEKSTRCRSTLHTRANYSGAALMRTSSSKAWKAPPTACSQCPDATCKQA